MIEALGITMVKNEADVIEAFVRHNLGFMDALAIVDNDSIDGTREILVQLQQEGLPIILFDDPMVGYFQAQIVTAVYRKVVPKFKPRFVFLLDADEFIVASSREALYVQLRAMRPGTQAQYCWRTYIPAPTGPEGDMSDPLRSITHRKVVERPWWKTVIVTDPKIDMKLKIQQGNHDVRYAGRSLRRVKLRDVAIAHLPVRSVDQITGKVLVGWIAVLERNRYRLDLGAATQWKLLYERIVRGPVLTTEDLTLEALRYAQFFTAECKWPRDVVRDPVVPAYARLTARPTTTCTPLQIVMRSVDKLFNPEANFSGRATGIEFLQNPDRKRTIWRGFAWPFTTGSGAEKGLYIDLPPFRHLAQRHRPASVLQIGCGSGAYLKYFASQGTRRIRGVDGAEGRSRYLQLDEYAQVDLGKPFELAENFDLVICVEVIEHIPAQSEHTLISSIARHARERIVFSGARAEKPGGGHIDCRPISHWLDLFASAGWYPCLLDSLALRSLSTFPWFRGNLVVLRRDGHGAVVARERLMELEQQEIKWNKQRPAVITHSFTETATKLLAHPDSRTVAVTNALLRRIWETLRAWKAARTQANAVNLRRMDAARRQ
jgi:SAM-dependent methyltransferase